MLATFRKVGRAAGRDDAGVSAVEYMVITGFLAALLFPFMLSAANALWNSNGSVSTLDASSSIVGRGPYNGPDGPVPGSLFNATISGAGTGRMNYIGMTASNGNLFLNIAPQDKVTGQNLQVYTVPYVPGGFSYVNMPGTNQTAYLSGALPGQGPAPKCSTNWSLCP